MDAAALNQLVQIKWALFAIAVCVVLFTVVGSVFLWSMAELPEILKGRLSFSDRAKKLLDQSKLDELIDLCRKHIDEFPGDAHGYWFQGQADFRKGNLRHALVSLRKVEELQPDWDAAHTRPLIELIEKRLSEPGEKRDLRVVVTPNSQPNTDVPPSGGMPIS
jgi:cytochrome c-type biogenesis protein CcmH/NrfG